MADRFKYAEVRQKMINMLKMDLLGPMEEDEVLEENPRHAYILGMLAPQSDNEKGATIEQEVDGDVSYDENVYSSDEDEDDSSEPVSTSQFKIPSSMGISFYVSALVEDFNVEISWGDYVKESTTALNKEGNEISKTIYVRQPQKETVKVILDSFKRSKEISLNFISDF